MTEATQPLLEVADLSVTFPSEAGPVAAARGLSYRVMPGEVLGIVGESGSGKSVSCLAVMGLLPSRARIAGSVRFKGRELLGQSDKDLSAIRGRRISMIFQDPLSALTPVYTVGDQLAEAVLIHQKVSEQAAMERAVELLALVGIPNPRQRATAFPHEFSGGMRQRAMIAMAIANEPELIIADEPTTALDVTIQAQILETMEVARKTTGASIIMITHDLGVIAGAADRVIVMYAGKSVETGIVDDVYYRPRMPYTLGLLGSIPRLDAAERLPLTPIDGAPPSLIHLPRGCPFTPRCPMRIEKCGQMEPELLAVSASGMGHSAACHRSHEIEEQNLKSTDIFPAPVIGEPSVSRIPRKQRATVLELKDMVKHFPLVKGAIMRRRVGTVFAVDGISLDIREGETLGLVGESGCGKTTTVLETLNLVRPASGTIMVLGRDTSTMSAQDRFAVRRELNVVFQDPLASLDPRMPVSDILAEPLQTHGVPVAERTRRVEELLRIVGLRPEHASRYPQEFSGGQRQRVGIARALALNPKLVILDEPVSALDVSIRAGIINLLEKLKMDLGLAYLFVAHDLSVVRHIADRVAVMYLGKIAEIGEVNRVFGWPAHPYTQALLSAIPLPDPRKERARRRIILKGDVPNPADPPSGCRFRTRCQKFANELTEQERKRCIDEEPPLYVQGGPDADQRAACHYAESYAVLDDVPGT
jgi:peptide/nickel transport system ATP-binding protein